MTHDGLEARVAVLETKMSHSDDAMELVQKKLDKILEAQTVFLSDFHGRGVKIATIEATVRDHATVVAEFREIRAQGRGVALSIGMAGVTIGGFLSWIATINGWLPFLGK